MLKPVSCFLSPFLPHRACSYVTLEVHWNLAVWQWDVHMCCTRQQRTAGLPECDALEERRDGGRDVALRGGHIGVRVVLHGVHVEQRPVVPRLAPLGRRLGGQPQAALDLLDHVLRQVLRRYQKPWV